MKPVVAIVGRPNVGKSSLFNRLIGRRKAITKAEPGVTRDVNYADCEEKGRIFTLVDTGGFEPAAKEGILRQIKEQAILAMEEADVIILLMDARTGPTPSDRELVEMLRKTEKKVIYAANKVDARSLMDLTAEFYSLGIDSILPVSAEHGLGTAELVDAVLDSLPEYEPVAEADEWVKVAIVGRPNAGKSSLLNRLLGRERAIVSEVPGTTRDSIDTPLERDGRKYLFIDTAGIRKKQRISRRLETYCVVAAIKSIERCDLSLLVIDGNEGVRTQDEKIGGLIEDRGKACIIVVNKWDLVEKDTDTMRIYTEAIRSKMPFLSFAPLVFVSALTGRRVEGIFDTIDRVMEEGSRRIPTSKLNQLLAQFTKAHRPPAYRGREIRFYYTTQVGTAPQRLAVFTNYPAGVPDSYRRYLVNRFRESLGLMDVPLRISFRSRR